MIDIFILVNQEDFCSYQFNIENKYVLFYDHSKKYFLNWDTLALTAKPEFCVVQDDYVIIAYDKIGQMDLKVNGVARNCHDYDLVNFKLINRDAIIIHHKYKHTFMVEELKKDAWLMLS